MKSFIKSHKRNESGQSVSTSSTKTPVSSPRPTFTKSPSPVNSNSPKKLLMPIKNLFNKRARTAESLSLATSDMPAECDPPYASLTSLSRKPKQNPTIIVRRKDSCLKVTNRHAAYNSDSDSSVSSNESNFSFVRDMKGGRNTSIKYYKTKKPDKVVPDAVYFDSNMELDDVEDYDFENNGLEDDEDLNDLVYAEEEEEVPSALDFEDTNAFTATLKQATIDSYEEEPVPCALSFEDDFKAMNLNEQGTVEALGFDGDEFEIERDNSFSRREPETIIYRSNPVLTLDSPFLERNNLATNSAHSFIQSPYDHPHGEGDGLGIISKSSFGNSSSSFDMYDYRDSESSNMKPYFEHNKKPFYKSYHFSVDEIRPIEEVPIGAADMLSNFLGIDSSHFEVSASPNVDSFENFNLFDLNSPIINGLTIGNSMTARFKNLNANNIKSFHGSFDEVELSSKVSRALIPTTKVQQTRVNEFPDNPRTPEIKPAGSSEVELRDLSTSILEMLQDKKSEVSKQNTSSKSLEISPTVKRKSVNDMMNLLENLQSKTSSENKRKSVENMMHFLKHVQNEDREDPRVKASEPVIAERPESCKKVKDVGLELEDSETFFANKQSYNELNENEIDLLDEINQLPEDFDFDQVSSLNKFNALNSFMRSNSFNKKPKKAVQSTNSSTFNQIKTANKTVTYYAPSQVNSQKQGSTNTQLSPITEKHTPRIPTSNNFNLVTISEDKTNYQ